MPADRFGFSFFGTGKFAALTKPLSPNRKVVNGDTEARPVAHRGSLDNSSPISLWSCQQIRSNLQNPESFKFFCWRQNSNRGTVIARLD